MCCLRLNRGGDFWPPSVKMDLPRVVAEKKIREGDSKCYICRENLDKDFSALNFNLCFICHKKRLAAARKLLF